MFVDDENVNEEPINEEVENTNNVDTNNAEASSKTETVEVEATRVESNTNTTSTSNSNKPKSKIAAGILGIFLGCFGVHNFYLGYTGKAVGQLVLTIVGIITSCLFIGVFLVIGAEIWGLIEGIMILTGNIDKDANGVPLED